MKTLGFLLASIVFTTTAHADLMQCTAQAQECSFRCKAQYPNSEEAATQCYQNECMPWVRACIAAEKARADGELLDAIRGY